MESDKVRILGNFKQKKKVFVSQSNENTFFALSKSVKFSLVFRHNRARFSADQKRGSGFRTSKRMFTGILLSRKFTCINSFFPFRN